MATSKQGQANNKPGVKNESAAMTLSEQPVQAGSGRREIGINDFVVVKSGFQGTLTYQSPRTHEVFTWKHYGDELDMSFGELRNAWQSYKEYFENNWFLLDDVDVIEALGASRCYKNATAFGNFDAVLKLPAQQMREAVAKMTDGQRSTLIFRAKALIRTGELDSMRSIRALEDCLGVDLIDG